MTTYYLKQDSLEGLWDEEKEIMYLLYPGDELKIMSLSKDSMRFGTQEYADKAFAAILIEKAKVEGAKSIFVEIE